MWSANCSVCNGDLIQESIVCAHIPHCEICNHRLMRISKERSWNWGLYLWMVLKIYWHQLHTQREKSRFASYQNINTGACSEVFSLQYTELYMLCELWTEFITVSCVESFVKTSFPLSFRLQLLQCIMPNNKVQQCELYSQVIDILVADKPTCQWWGNILS